MFQFVGSIDIRFPSSPTFMNSHETPFELENHAVNFIVTVSFPYQALSRMKEDWKDIEFVFVQYKDTGISILSAVDDLQVSD